MIVCLIFLSFAATLGLLALWAAAGGGREGADLTASSKVSEFRKILAWAGISLFALACSLGLAVVAGWALRSFYPA